MNNRISKKGRVPMAEVIIMAAGVCCLAYYILIVSYAGFKAAFSGAWLLAGCVLFLLEIILTIDKKYDFLRIIPKWVLVTAGMIVAIGGLLFFILFGCVLSKIRAYPEKKADYCIVLGAQIRGERITRSLKYRLDAAYAYYNENPDCMLIVSGGQGDGENISEAEAMKKYLISLGVPEDRIIMEDASTSTNENLRFSYEIIKDREDEDSAVVICSNNFHVFRALKLAENIGIDSAEGLAASSDKILEFNYMIRDSLAIFKELLLGNIKL